MLLMGARQGAAHVQSKLYLARMTTTRLASDTWPAWRGTRTKLSPDDKWP
jgi:hypothetical protein